LVVRVPNAVTGILDPSLVRSLCAVCFAARVGFCAASFRNLDFPRDFASCSVPVLSAQNDWFSTGFSHIGPIALAFCAYPCMSMPAGAAPVEIIVLCAALDPKNISVSRASESPESSQNPRFSRENMWFCSGGAGFELVEFES